MFFKLKTLAVHSKSWMIVGILAVGILLVTVAVSTFASAASKNTSPVPVAFQCNQPTIVAAEKGVPHLDFSHVSLPKDMPIIAATVNEQGISSTELETQVKVVQFNHQEALAMLPTNAPEADRNQLSVSVNKIREDTLNEMINDKLLLQEGIKAGKFVSVSSAQSYIRDMLAFIHKSPQTSSTYVKFIAYLCANHLTEASFLTDSTVIRSYQESLTIAAVRNNFVQALPQDVRQNPGKVNSLLSDYVQSLRQKAKIQIFVPNSLLSNK